MGQEFDWSTLAPKWDAMLTEPECFVNHQEGARRFHWFMKRAVKIGNRTKSFRLLDLGCGTGEAAWPLWKRVASVTFFDKCVDMLRLARNKYPKGIFVRGDARALPFLNNEFDVIVSRGAVISQTNDPKAFLEGIWRILRPEGYVLMDFVADKETWNSMAPVQVEHGLNRKAFETLLKRILPDARIVAYDGTDAHALNRIVFRKPLTSGELPKPCGHDTQFGEV